MSLESRFTGDEGKKRLIEELCNQTIIRGDKDTASKIVGFGKVRTLQSGETLIEQGAATNDIYFVLAGKFDVLINNRLIASRTAGQQVGDSKNSSAAKAALQIVYAIKHIVEPEFKAYYTSSDYQFEFSIGIDSSNILAAKSGIRGANDLV